LGASAAIDSYSLLVAYRALVDNAAAKEMTLREFVESGHDPTSVAVVAEDLAAVSGCAIAAGALFATQVTGNAIFDAAGSGAFVFTLVPIRPRRRGTRRSLRTFSPGASLRPSPTPRFQSPPATPFNSNSLTPFNSTPTITLRMDNHPQSPSAGSSASPRRTS
jgi:hypothetical protein